jgi:hypothetical protein
MQGQWSGHSCGMIAATSYGHFYTLSNQNLLKSTCHIHASCRKLNNGSWSPSRPAPGSVCPAAGDGICQQGLPDKPPKAQLQPSTPCVLLRLGPHQHPPRGDRPLLRVGVQQVGGHQGLCLMATVAKTVRGGQWSVARAVVDTSAFGTHVSSAEPYAVQLRQPCWACLWAGCCCLSSCCRASSRPTQPQRIARPAP